MEPKKRILIVDDEEQVLQAIMKSIMLKRRDQYEPIVCVDGNEALDTLHHRQIDLVVLDLRMANMDGLTLARKMKEAAKMKDIPIIISSGHLSGPIMAELTEIGIEHFLSKPYPMKDLLEEIDTVMHELA